MVFKYGGSIFKGKGDIRDFICYRSMIFLVHGMKVVESVLKMVLWSSYC